MRINSGLRFLVLDVDLDWRGGEVRKKLEKKLEKKVRNAEVRRS